MGFYINNLKDLSKPSTTTVHGVCLQCKTKPITGSRKKFCSIECGQKYHQRPKKRRTNKKVKCNWCSEIFVPKKGTPQYYCSKDCYNQKIYEQRKGFSRTDVSRIVDSHIDVDLSSDSYRFNGWLPGHIIMNDEITATLVNLPNKPYIYEDVAELNRIIIEELPPATLDGGIPYIKSNLNNFRKLDFKILNKRLNGKRKEPVAVDEEKSSSDTPTKN